MLNFLKKTKSPLECQFISIREKIVSNLKNDSCYNNLSSSCQFLEAEYKIFIATILSGSLLRLKLQIKQNILDDNDPIMKEIFRLVISESTIFQEKYLLSEKIEVLELSSEKLKYQQLYFKYIKDHYDNYHKDIEYGIRTKEFYYLEDVNDPDEEISAIIHQFSFINDLYYIESVETNHGIRIQGKNFFWDMEMYNHCNSFFPSLVNLYNTI